MRTEGGGEEYIKEEQWYRRLFNGSSAADRLLAVSS